MYLESNGKRLFLPYNALLDRRQIRKMKVRPNPKANLAEEIYTLVGHYPWIRL